MQILEFPTLVQYEVTANCNVNCVYCYNIWKTDTWSISPELTTEASLGVINECGSNGVMRFIFTGGEPTVREDIPELLRCAGKYDSMLVSFLTNGILLSDRQDVLNELKTFDIHVQLTFLGFQSHDRLAGSNGSKEKVLDSLDLLLSKGISTSINIVFLDQTKTELDTTIEFFCKRDIRVGLSRCIPRLPVGGKELDKERASDLYALMTKYNCSTFMPLPICTVKDQFMEAKRPPGSGCTAGYLLGVIGPSGKIRGCTHSPQEFDNVSTVGLRKAWKSLDPYRKSFASIPIPCNECDINGVCRAYCRELITQNGDDPWISDPIKLDSKNFYTFSKKQEDFLLNTAFSPYSGLRSRKENVGVTFISERRVITLNNTASFIVESLCDGNTGKNIIGKLSTKYFNENFNDIKSDVLNIAAISYLFRFITK